MPEQVTFATKPVLAAEMLKEQRRYGEAFRALDEFERQVKKLAELGDRAASLARDGLTSGALRPSAQERPVGCRDTPRLAS